jgi:Domain of unknown function (DUF927)
MPTKTTINKEIGRQMLAIVATEFHLELRQSYYKVQFYDLEGQKQIIRLGRELFTTPSKVVAELLKANANIPDDLKTALRMVMHAHAHRSTRSWRVTIRTGFHGNSFVYPTKTFGPEADTLKHEGESSIDPALGLQHGSVQAWWQGLKRAFHRSDYLIFAASVALSGPLFEVAGEQEGVVFHFQPQQSDANNKAAKTKSSSGKTLAARVAASTIGRAQKTDLISFALTQRGLEDYCYSHNNLVGILDEEGRSLSGPGRNVKPSQLPYLLTSDRGTVRSKKASQDPDLQNLTWLLPVISTGEQPLDDSNRLARTEGAQVRMAPIPVPPGAEGGIFNRLDGSPEEIVQHAFHLAQEVEQALMENYGVAMPENLQMLYSRRNVASRIRRIVNYFVKWVGADSTPWDRRLATKFGIVLAAALFASKYGGATWTLNEAAETIRRIYERSRWAMASVSDATDALVAKLRAALADKRFPQLEKGQTMAPQDAGCAWGITRRLVTHGSVSLITLARLKHLIQPSIISDGVISELSKRGIIVKDPDGKTTRLTMLRGLHGSKRRRYVVIKLSALVEAV